MTRTARRNATVAKLRDRVAALDEANAHLLQRALRAEREEAIPAAALNRIADAYDALPSAGCDEVDWSRFADAVHDGLATAHVITGAVDDLAREGQEAAINSAASARTVVGVDLAADAGPEWRAFAARTEAERAVLDAWRAVHVDVLRRWAAKPSLDTCLTARAELIRRGLKP